MSAWLVTPESLADAMGVTIAEATTILSRLTPVAPEVPPRRDGLREALERLHAATLGGPLVAGMYPLVERAVAESILREALAGAPQGEKSSANLAPATPEPPDSGDAAGPREFYSHQHDDMGPDPHIHRRDAGIDAAALTRAGLVVWKVGVGFLNDPAEGAAALADAARLRAAAPAEAREEGPEHRMGPPRWEPGLAQDEWANRCLVDGELWPCAAIHQQDTDRAAR